VQMFTEATGRKLVYRDVTLDEFFCVGELRRRAWKGGPLD
jgi:hypothetical protein